MPYGQMQVRTGAVARIPRNTKLLTGIHCIALANGHTIQMAV